MEKIAKKIHISIIVLAFFVMTFVFVTRPIDTWTVVSLYPLCIIGSFCFLWRIAIQAEILSKLEEKKKYKIINDADGDIRIKLTGEFTLTDGALEAVNLLGYRLVEDEEDDI